MFQSTRKQMKKKSWLLSINRLKWKAGFFCPKLRFSLNRQCVVGGLPGGSVVKNLTAKQQMRVRSLGWEDPLEKEVTTHSNILAWKIPCTEGPGLLQSTVLQRVGHDWAINTNFYTLREIKYVNVYEMHTPWMEWKSLSHVWLCDTMDCICQATYTNPDMKKIFCEC